MHMHTCVGPAVLDPGSTLLEHWPDVASPGWADRGRVLAEGGGGSWDSGKAGLLDPMAQALCTQGSTCQARRGEGMRRWG